MSFTLVEVLQKLLFWYGVKLFYDINVLHMLKSYTWDEFSV